MDTTLAQLKTQIEELEKRIKSLSNQVTTQGYMTGLKTCLEEIKTLFSTYQTQLNEHLTAYQTHTDAFNSHLSDYTALSQAVEDLEDDIETINETLASLSGGGSDVDYSQEIAQIQNDITTINSTLTSLSNASQTASQDISDLTSDISTINSTLSGATQDISDIESDITTINSTLSSLANTSQDISEIESEISTINSTLTSLTDLPQDVSELEEDVSTINSSISTLSSSIDDLEDADIALSARVTTLENASSSTGSGATTTDTIRFTKDQIGARVYQGDTTTYKTPRCQFICDTSGKVTISYQIVGKLLDTDATWYRMRIYLNDEVIKERDIDGNAGGFILSDSCTFLPQEDYNFFYVQFNMGDVSIREYSVTIEGNSVEFLQQDLPLKINCFNNSYYIIRLDDYRRRIYYGVQPKDELNVSTSYLSYIEGTNTPTEGVSYLYLMPTTKIENGVVAFDTQYSEPYKFFGTLDKNGLMCSYTLESSSIVKEVTYDVDPLYFEPIYGGIGVTATSASDSPDAIFLINDDGNVFLVGTGSGLNDAISYNGEKLYYTSYRIGAVVRDINNKIGSPSYFRGIIAWNKDTKKNVFFPSIISTYMVEIADGKNVTAYYQTNGNINVYINRGMNVYKYVLELNSETNQYELSSLVTTIEGITRYEELYDGKYLVYRNTQWEIVTP